MNASGKTGSPRELEHLWMGNVVRRAASASGNPLVLERGEGIYLWDTEGNRYIDAIASLETVAVGHGREEIWAAVDAQYRKLEFFDTLRYTSAPTVALADRLAALTPGDLSRVHFATSGSEAVEAALKIIRQFHLLQGDALRTKVIARRGAYHGCTLGAMELDGNYYRTRREVFAPRGTARFVSDPMSVDEIADLIAFERPETVAAVVIDPLATASGVFAPPPGFWRDLRQVCDDAGVLLMADEVITAFGRTGRWFASGQDGVAPDLITVSKGLSSGYFPVSAAIASSAISDAFESAGEGLSHGHTFGGHPVAAAAALANLQIIESEGLVGNAAKVGAHLGHALIATIGEDPGVFAIRGEGLLWGIELASVSTTSAVEFSQAVLARLRMSGVLTFVLHPGNVLFLCPPLIINREQADELVNLVAEAIRSVRKEIS